MKDFSKLSKLSETIDPFFPYTIPPEKNIPERMLLTAVIERAISDLVGGPKERRSAAEWFRSDDTSYLFSFLNICSILDLDAKTLRRGITELLRKERTKGDRVLLFRKRTYYSKDLTTVS